MTESQSRLRCRTNPPSRLISAKQTVQTASLAVATAMAFAALSPKVNAQVGHATPSGMSITAPAPLASSAYPAVSPVAPANSLPSLSGTIIAPLPSPSAPGDTLPGLVGGSTVPVTGGSVPSAGSENAPPAEGVTPVPLNTTDTPLPPTIQLPPSNVPLPGDVPTTPLTADQAALVALRHQPSITVAAGNLTSAAGVTEQAKSALLPALTASTGFTQADKVTGNGATTTVGGTSTGTSTSSSGTSTSTGGTTTSANGPTFTGNFGVKQLLFDFGHTPSTVSQARNLETSNAQTLTKAQSDTVLQVKQAFYTLAQNERLVTVNEANYRSQVYHLDLAKGRLAAGVGLASDVVTAQTAVSEAALTLNIAQNNAEVSRVLLATAMGLDARAPIQIANSSEPDQSEHDSNALVALALRTRPDVLAAVAAVNAAQDGVSAARTSNAPSIAGSVSYADRGTAFVPQSSSVTTGVTITFDPFDSGLTAGRVEQAKGNLQTAQANLLTVQQSVTSDVAQAYLNELLAAQRVSQANDEVTNAQEGISLAEGRFKAGVALYLEISDAQQALIVAQTDLVNAQSSLDQAKASLAHAVGVGLVGLSGAGH